MNKKVLLAITGATGMLYVSSLLEHLNHIGIEVHAIISDAGRKVLQLELSLQAEDLPFISRWFASDNFAAQPASGSVIYDAMVVLPCTMGTLAAVSTGYCSNLIHRAADVSLKEKRKLILGIRETPLNRTHLRNMLKAHDAGATIFPLMPSFYTHPADFNEMANNLGGRICDILGYREHSYSRWQGE